MARKSKKDVKRGGHLVSDPRVYGLMQSGVRGVRQRIANPNGGQLAAPIIKSIRDGHLKKHEVLSTLNALCDEMHIDTGTRTQMYRAINRKCPD